jgi:hypothetical protein
MSHPLSRLLRRRTLRRVAVAAAALVPAATISVAAAEHANAAGCATNGQVYVTSVSPWSVRTEDQSGAGFDNHQRIAAGATSFVVGGNGLRPGTTPYWTITSNVTGLYVFFGRSAGSNCVANEAYVSIPRATQPGEVWTVTTNYDTGNSSRAIRNQNHFQINWTAAPSLPPGFPPVPCFYCR